MRSQLLMHAYQRLLISCNICGKFVSDCFLLLQRGFKFTLFLSQPGNIVIQRDHAVMNKCNAGTSFLLRDFQGCGALVFLFKAAFCVLCTLLLLLFQQFIALVQCLHFRFCRTQLLIFRFNLLCQFTLPQFFCLRCKRSEIIFCFSQRGFCLLLL